MNEQESTSQAKNIFLKASAYIRKYGWRVNGMGKHGQPRCSMGALKSSWPKGLKDMRVSKLMYDKLYEELKGLTLTQFNEKYRDGEKVAFLFEQTAKKL